MEFVFVNDKKYFICTCKPNESFVFIYPRHDKFWPPRDQKKKGGQD